MPVRSGAQPRLHARRRVAAAKTRAMIMLRVRGCAAAAGTHAIVLMLSRSAVRRLSGLDSVVITIRIIVVDARGSGITRSLEVTVRR